MALKSSGTWFCLCGACHCQSTPFPSWSAYFARIDGCCLLWQRRKIGSTCVASTKTDKLHPATSLTIWSEVWCYGSLSIQTCNHHGKKPHLCRFDCLLTWFLDQGTLLYDSCHASRYDLACSTLPRRKSGHLVAAHRSPIKSVKCQTDRLDSLDLV